MRMKLRILVSRNRELDGYRAGSAVHWPHLITVRVGTGKRQECVVCLIGTGQVESIGIWFLFQILRDASVVVPGEDQAKVGYSR